MPEITAAVVKELREETNVGMMECKNALIEAGGDKEKAVRILRERGIAIATKKASRAANQGLIAAALAEDGTTGALVEVNCETDFVARNENFQAFTRSVAEKAMTTDGNVADLVKDEVTAKVAEIGENLIVRRSVRYQAEQPGMVVTYIHLGGKLGVMLEIGCTQADTLAKDGFKDAAKDLALHVTACNPRYLDRSQVPQDMIDSEKEIYAKQAEGKPPAVVEKIVEGRLNKKFFCEICFLDQGFVKEPEKTITQWLDEVGKSIGDTVTVRRFVRYQLGE